MHAKETGRGVFSGIYDLLGDVFYTTIPAFQSKTLPNSFGVSSSNLDFDIWDGSLLMRSVLPKELGRNMQSRQHVE